LGCFHIRKKELIVLGSWWCKNGGGGSYRSQIQHPLRKFNTIGVAYTNAKINSDETDAQINHPGKKFLNLGEDVVVMANKP